LVYSVLNDATLADGSVENIKMADMPALTVKGAVASGAPQDLTPNQTIGILNSGTTKFGASVLPSATTAASGIVQLYDGIDSVSASTAATANATKIAYDAAIAASGVAATALPVSGGTMTGQLVLDEIKESVYTLAASGTIALDPANGSIQTSVLSGAPTFTDSLETGQTIVLMLENGSSYTVTWPSGTTWASSAGNVAPTLTAKDTVVFWKVSTSLYGAYVGSYV